MVSPVMVSASPGRTGAFHFRYSRPGEPMEPESRSGPSQTVRMVSAQVCQPLAISPFQRLLAAHCGSVWNGCGSHKRAKSMISASLSDTGPSVRVWPGVKSLKFMGAEFRGREAYGRRRGAAGAGGRGRKGAVHKARGGPRPSVP